MIRTIGIATLFAVCVGGALWVSSSLLAVASQRTVTYQYISDALETLGSRSNQVTWLPEETVLTRPFTEGDGTLIGTAMTQAWYSLAVAQHTGESTILADGFSGVAQERAVQSVEDAKRRGQFVVLGQEARPKFYHLDGSVFQAEVEMLTTRYVIEDDQLSYFEVVKDLATTTMMNESNGWRVYAHERFESEPISVSKVEWNGPTLAGINYYPANTPWTEFWAEFDPVIVAEDLEAVRDLGANAVRFFLTTDIFSNPITQPQALDDLETFLDLAKSAGLVAVPTLFDLKPTFDPASWSNDRAYLKAVLSVLRASDAVAFIDLKNEPDLDFEHHGYGQILAWLKTMIIITRSEAPDMPLTIGWSNSDDAIELIDMIDVVTYHDYAPIEGAADRLAALQTQTGLPVLVTEVGVTSYNLFFESPSSEKAQSTDLRSRIEALLGADGIFIWTLHDFPNVDAKAVGGSPWVQRLQSKFGLFDELGNPKQSAQVVRDAFRDLVSN